ncbi:MAG: TolC family protein [Planctomycetes bacterium]|nr:TolC family protein [Planctomycetota bacterium]
MKTEQPALRRFSLRDLRVVVPALVLASCRGPAPDPIDADTLAMHLASRSSVDVMREALDLLPHAQVDEDLDASRSRQSPRMSTANASAKAQSSLDNRLLANARGLDGKLGQGPHPDDRVGMMHGHALDAARVEFWRASAHAWSIGVRRAVVAWNQSHANRDGAGLPGDIGLGAEVDDVEDLDASLVLRASFDILRLLGLGPAHAARELANAQARAAFGELDRAVWASRFDVERARVRLAASRARIAARSQLVDEFEDDATRLQVYEAHEWIPAGPAAAGRALMSRARQDLNNERVLEASLTEALASRAGLLASDAALGHVAPETLDEYSLSKSAIRVRHATTNEQNTWARTPATNPPHEETLPDTETNAPARPARRETGRKEAGPVDRSKDLLGGHPYLRAAMLDYAVAEARVRRAASDAWPGIRIGPKQRLEPQDLLGGFLELTLPWPGRVDAATRVALASRRDARVVVEERLRELMSRIDTSAARFARARDAVLNATALEAASRSAWTAAQAVWSVEASAMGMFNDALERRLGGVVAVINARETAVLALLDHEEAIGDAPREAGTKTGHARSATEDAPGFASGLPGGRDE